MRTISSNKLHILLILSAVLLCLAGCAPAPIQPPTVPSATEIIELPIPTQSEGTEATDPYAGIETLSLVVTAEDIHQLEDYPDLKTLDLSGSGCYDAILKYMDRHPEVDVTYSVALGSTRVSNKETGITLNPADFDFPLLLENLVYLPQLEQIHFADIALTAEQIASLQEAWPELKLEYSVELLGQTYGLDTTELDLSSVKSADVASAAQKLGLLTNLTTVELMPSTLTLEEVDQLQTAAPGAVFHYEFTLFGKTVSTTDEEIKYSKHNMGNEAEPELRRALAVLDHCKRFVLENCGIDTEILVKLREDFRGGPKVVWRIYFGQYNKYSAYTDAETIRAVYNVFDDTIADLKYCEDVKYMDIGHNDYLTDLSFIGYMPNIEVLIASGCAASNLAGFENCKKLTWLELAYATYLTDISALEGCEGLKYLNLSYTKVKDYMPLDGLPLERFVCLSPKAPVAEQEIFLKIHDTCLTRFYGSQPYGYGWRYDDNGMTFNQYYKEVVRTAFNYDYLETLLPKDDKK